MNFLGAEPDAGVILPARFPFMVVRVNARKIDMVLAAAAVLVLGLLTGVYSGDLALGIAGEWVWPRVGADPTIARLLFAMGAVAAYGGFATLGHRALGAPSRTAPREAVWVAGLAGAAVALQVAVAIGAPAGYGLTRWADVHCLRGAAGYYNVAREQAAADPWAFLADYPEWIQAQGPGHLGTHPPGLIALYSGLIALMERHDAASDFLLAAMPAATEYGFRRIENALRTTIPPADRAAIYLTSLLTLLACAGAAAPVYLLARASTSPQVSWASAALWPLAPALNLFQPLSDAAYPLLSATALAAAAWSIRLRGASGRPAWAWAAPAVASGAVMGLGMMFTLAFLPVGPIAALVVLADRSTSFPRRVQAIALIGVGFVAVVALAWLATGADPLVVWWWNLRNNARFNEDARRSYVAWLVVNPIELAVAAGLPVAVWCLVGAVGDRRRVPRAAWCALVVLALVDLSGHSRGETARLWMIFLPPLFTASGVGLARLGGGPQAIFVTALSTGLQTVGLQGLIQVVYPPM